MKTTTLRIVMCISSLVAQLILANLGWCGNGSAFQVIISGTQDHTNGNSDKHHKDNKAYQKPIR